MSTTWYHQQLLKLKDTIYPREDLCDKVRVARQFIDTCYYTGISLDDMAVKACLSKFHFIRLFKRIYGITPNQYLVSVRLEKAKALLQSGAKVTTACFSVGFDSTTTFAGLFKKIMGKPPSEAQKKQAASTAIPPYMFLSKKQF